MTQVAALSMSPKADSPEAIGAELRAALPGLRLHSLSLHDAEGDVLWLNEGVLGPDEHGVVLEALSGSALESTQALVDRPLGDGRNALILPVRATSGELVGAAMMIVDTKQISGALLRKLATSSVRDALDKLAARQQPARRARVVPPPAAKAPAPPPPLKPAVTAAQPANPSSSEFELELAPDVPRQLPAEARLAAKPPVTAPAGRLPPPARTAVAPTPASPPPPPASAKAAPAPVWVEPESDITLIAPKLDTSDLALYVQQLLKLRPGGRTRRYEVLLRSRNDPTRDAAPPTLKQATTALDANSALDRYVLVELVKWLGKHRDIWEAEPSSFTVNLSATTLKDPGFLSFASGLFEEHEVTPGVVGFEIPEQACIDAPGAVAEFVERCERLGAFLALDDFSLHSAAQPLLASAAVRLVKIDARLTLGAMKDKLPQAMVVAISQAAKVLGIHCVAKRVDSSMARQWLAAIGIDFAQGFSLERPQALDSLLQRNP